MGIIEKFCDENYRPGEICYNLRTSEPFLMEFIDQVILWDLIQVFNFPTRIPNCNFYTFVLSGIFLDSKSSYRTMAYWFGRWITNPGVPGSRAFCGSMTN